MQKYLVDMLCCPVCQGTLQWVVTEQNSDRLETAEARCTGCEAAYPVREGIGLFLTPDLPRNDLWEQVDRGLIRYLQANPEREKQLLDSPIASLNPADQLFRAFALEEKGAFAAAHQAQTIAFRGLYTPEYMECWQRQADYVLTQLAQTTGSIVDLASGRGYLVERITRELDRLVVASDFSPRVLRRNRQHLQHQGLYEKVSLLAFDARRTPFKDGAVTTMTTNLGLPNIEEPGSLLQELRRVVSDQFLAISYFFPPDDVTNGMIIREAHLDTVLYEGNLMTAFAAANWSVSLKNQCRGQANPTPKGEILPARPDGLPAATTELMWSVLVATGEQKL